MSDSHYAKVWLETQEDLQSLIKLDQSILEHKTIVRPANVVNTVLELYLRYKETLVPSHAYRRIVNRLMVCYDRMVQPQIRIFIKKMLEYAIVRMLEYRRELFDLMHVDYFCPNDILIKMKMTPDDIDLLTAGKCQLELRNEFLNTLINESTETEKLKMSSQTTSEKEETGKHAISLIQKHERARVARNIAAKVKLQRNQVERRLTDENPTIDKTKETEKLEKAAIVIQKHWRGVRARRKIKLRYEKMEEFLGMTMPAWKSKEIFKTSQIDDIGLSNDQKAALENLENRTRMEKERIWKTRGPSLVEDIEDEIRQWFLLWFEELGYFDHLPLAKEGGSILVTTGQVRTPQEYLSSLSTKEDKNRIDESDEDFDSKDKNETEDWQLRESKALGLLLQTDEEFMNYWHFRSEEILNPKGGLIMDLIRDRLFYELQLEMREKADDTMRAELNSLNQALLADHAHDPVKFALPKPQKYPEFTRDINNNKTTMVAALNETKVDPTDEEMLLKLIHWKVLVRQYSSLEYQLSKWPGVESYANLKDNREAALGDVVKQAVVDYCIMPMSSKLVHELAPLVRSVCLCGLPASGQLFVARAVCAELQATVLDLSPDKHSGRFTNKASQAALVKSVIKVAKAFAPSVVLVEACDKAYFKSKTSAKRFAPLYKKIVKAIKAGDQVLFLTTSSDPYKAGQPFVKLHDKFIIIPVADYGSTYLSMKKQLMSHRSVDRHLNVSCIAKLAAGYSLPIETILEALDDCLAISRRIDFRRKPLLESEILERVFLASKLIRTIDRQSFAKFLAKLKK